MYDNRLLINRMDLWEKAEEFSVNLVGDLLEILRTILELDLIDIDDQQMTVIFLDQSS